MEEAHHEPPGALPRYKRSLAQSLRRAVSSLREYFAEQDPTFWVAFTPALFVCAFLFVRSPTSNYIFDEQEALLANPYVNAQGLRFWDVVRRDFWGLPPERSIGSYRPIPNLVWRVLWHVSKEPFIHHWVNVVGHAANASLVASLAFFVTRKRRIGWLAGACFATSAVLTEAVSGVVGIADVLGGLGVLLGAHALRLPLVSMPFGVFFGMSFGLFSKESAIVGVPLLAWTALASAPAWHGRPHRFLRALLALFACIAALVAYTEFRRRFFPVTLPETLAAPLPSGTPWPRRALRAFLRWFQQPQLPNDPINNPLVLADVPHRIAGALRVFARGIGQLCFPWTLSGDYSFPQEPKPNRLVFPESVLGALLLLGLPLFGLVTWLRGLFRERRERRNGTFPSARLSAAWALALGAVWLPVAYFPHSNLVLLLPTVRAERFLYLPTVGWALMAGVLLDRLLELRASRHSGSYLGGLGQRIVVAFFAVQAIAARAHAADYSDDLAFWDATRRAVPNSAKAHLNYSVMVGARGDLERRLEANRRAVELAPDWAMGHVYYGDTLCRMRHADAAWPHYKRGFELAPNDPNLVALGLQCLWDQGGVESRKDELLELASRHTGSWLALLATELVHSGKQHGGIQPKYRPRSYNEGPKSD